MKAYPIWHLPEYDGSGYALAAISDNQVVALAYIRDIDADLNTANRFVDEMTPADAAHAVGHSAKCAARARFLEERGFSQVAFGLASGAEFNLL